jgi:hypothetical protein
VLPATHPWSTKASYTWSAFHSTARGVGWPPIEYANAAWMFSATVVE